MSQMAAKKAYGKRIAKIFICALLCAASLFLVGQRAMAEGETPAISININGTDSTPGTSQSLQILLLLTILSVAPSIILMMTSFTRITIVFSFLKSGLGMQQTPPNQVLISLALFLTLFIMSPVISKVTTDAYKPFAAGEISQEEAVNRAMKPVREFMFKQTKGDKVNLFLDLRGQEEAPQTLDQIPNDVLIPAFMLSELERAFIMGFLIIIPFLIIDMVVASNLMSLGMIMLPPMMISLPFKIILFILVGGWDLVVKTLVASFA